MEIYFRNRKLKKLCESERELIRSFGPRQGRLTAVRLSELRALPNLAAAKHVPHLKLHQLSGNRDEQFAVTLVEPDRLILEIATDPIPRLDDGGVDRESVTAVVVIEVVDYH